MRKGGAKRVVTIMMVISYILVLAALQPAYFGVHIYFGLYPAVIIMPISFISIVFTFLHVYQNWQLMLAWFKKSPDKKKQRDKTRRAAVLIALILAVVCALAFGWYEGLKALGEGKPPPLESMRIFSWVAFTLVVIHVWQRWRLTFSYFRRKPSVPNS